VNTSRVLIADDHPLIVNGLLLLLDPLEFEIVDTVTDGRTLIETAIKRAPDIILADISMPVLSGIEAIRQLRQAELKSKIIILTMHANVTYAVEALTAGASGYVVKTSAGEELLSAIREIQQGRIYVATAIREAVMAALEAVPKRVRSGTDLLTSRQRDVLKLLARGLQNKEIAAELHVSPKTVEFHKQQMKSILGAQTVAELVVYATRQGIAN